LIGSVLIALWLYKGINTNRLGVRSLIFTSEDDSFIYWILVAIGICSILYGIYVFLTYELKYGANKK
ncbi:MAG: hypothetical protein ACI96W_003602, partial [Paraglaciecola sp.]